MPNRYFIAIIPPEPIEKEIFKLKTEVSQHYFSHAALKSPSHITLHMPFTLEKKVECRFLENINEWNIYSPAFHLELSGFSHFRSKVIFISVIENQTLNKLREVVVDYMKLNFNIFNQADDRKPFHPHITIAFRDLKKNQFDLAWNNFSSRVFNANFTCESVWILKWNNQEWIKLKEIKLINCI